MIINKKSLYRVQFYSTYKNGQQDFAVSIDNGKTKFWWLIRDRVNRDRANITIEYKISNDEYKFTFSKEKVEKRYDIKLNLNQILNDVAEKMRQIK